MEKKLIQNIIITMETFGYEATVMIIVMSEQQFTQIMLG